MDRERKRKMHALAIATIVLWATAFPLTKVVGSAVTPTVLGAARCTAAAVFLAALGISRGIRLPRSRKDAGLFALAGAAGFGFYMILFNTGITTLTSATSSLVIATTPVMTALAADRIYRERLSRVGYLSVATAFLGVVVLLFWKGTLSINSGILWTLAAAALFCGYNLLNRKLQAMGYTSLEVMTYAMISAAGILVCAAPETFSALRGAGRGNVLLILYMGIGVSAVGYLLWAKAFTFAEHTSEVTNYMFLTPLFTTALGFLLLREVPDFGTVLGGAIIIGSVLVFNRYGAQR